MLFYQHFNIFDNHELAHRNIYTIVKGRLYGWWWCHVSDIVCRKRQAMKLQIWYAEWCICTWRRYHLNGHKYNKNSMYNVMCIDGSPVIIWKVFFHHITKSHPVLYNGFIFTYDSGHLWRYVTHLLFHYRKSVFGIYYHYI